jgi:hypothetical protein
MANTIRHKHTAINPSTPTPKTDDVDGANWLEEHILNAPDIGAVLVGDPSQSDGANWVLPGSAGFVLVTMGGGALPVWQPVAFSVVLTTPGDLARGRAGTGVAERLPVGLERQVLTVVSGMPEWRYPVPEAGTTGDILYFSAPHVLAVRTIGSPGQVLTVVGGLPQWGTLPSSFANPMLALGDVIKGGASGVAERLPIGTNGQMLTVVSGAPAWAAPPVGFVNPMTTLGDLIRGGAGGAATRLGIGGENFLVESIGGLPTWTPHPIPAGVAGSLLVYTGAPRVLSTIAPGPDDTVLVMVGGVPTWVVGGGGGGGSPLPINQPGDLVAGDVGGSPVRFPVGATGQVLTATATGGKLVWSTPSPGFLNPMIAIGDIIVGGTSGAAQRLGIGAPGFVLKVLGGTPTWMADIGFDNPMTGVGDLIRGGAAGIATRLAPGSNGTWLTLSAGVPAWASLPIDPGFANPMTTLGDVITGGASGAPSRLGIGTAGQVLTVAGGVPTWATGGLLNPMTGVGDLIRGGASGAPTRLAPSTDGFFLTLAAGVPAWAAAPGFANPMTTTGDIIRGGASGAPTRLGIGSTGQVLTVAGGVPSWAAAVAGALPVTLRIEAATPPDGTGTINNPPEIIREVSTGTQTANTPKVTRTYAKFGDDTIGDQHLEWGFMMPSNWASGGTIRLKWKAADGITSGNVIWKAAASVTTDSSTDDDASVFNAAVLGAASAAPATQGQSKEVTIALNTTGFAANRWITVFIGRDADNASDTLVGNAILMGAQFEYA